MDITSAFLHADIHDDDTELVTPPPILVKMDIVKPNSVWHVKKAIYGLREAPRLWQRERDQKLRDLEFMYRDKLPPLVKLWVQGDASFAPTREKSQQGVVVYHGIAPNQRKVVTLFNGDQAEGSDCQVHFKL